MGEDVLLERQASHGLAEPVVSGRGARWLRRRKASSWGALPAPGVGAPVRAASGKPVRLGAVAVATQCMPCMCRACAMGHAQAMHVPFRAGGAAGGGGGEHLVEVVLRLERRGTCVRACVRARVHAAYAHTHAHDHMSRRLQRRGRAHDLGSDRRRSESCRLPRRAWGAGGAGVRGCEGCGVRGARGWGGCGRGCVRVCGCGCMPVCVRAGASEGWVQVGGLRAQERPGVQAG